MDSSIRSIEDQNPVGEDFEDVSDCAIFVHEIVDSRGLLVEEALDESQLRLIPAASNSRRKR